MKRRYKKQIKEELALQIEKCLPYYPEGAGIRLDSHRHFQMIPGVFDSVAELVKEKGYPLEYIRIIREKPVFYKKILQTECFRPVNIIKALLLDFLGRIDKKRQPDLYGKATAAL